MTCSVLIGNPSGYYTKLKTLIGLLLYLLYCSSYTPQNLIPFPEAIKFTGRFSIRGPGGTSNQSHRRQSTYTRRDRHEK